jgi:radical SAM superfamily enzyme YgiQ (UPF0313 family)
MRILLVAPGADDDLDNRIVREVSYLGAKALFGPHAVVSVAALTPPGHEIVVHDERMRGPATALLDREQFDIVGINLTTNQFNRALAIARHCKEHRPATIIVAGGIGAPMLLHHADHPFDVVFHGEAEETWPAFINDVVAGKHSPVYQRYARPDLSNAPAPRWDLIAEDIPRYGTLSVQTTRGCPHDCAFCDVIYTYGRTPRSKRVEQVIEEIRLLARLGASMVFIADDNFGGGNRAYARELLRAIGDLNRSLDLPILFMTQVDILVSKDPELLELMADANFVDLMIGIESVNQDALRDMNKVQNLRVDPVEAVRTIQSYGIAVLGHMIVGNDSDDTTAFAQTEQFVQDANILHHFCHPLMAPPGTRVWYQYAREGRLVKLTDAMADRLDIVPNIEPKRMTRAELLEGLADYWERVNQPAAYLKRALRFIKGVTRRPNVKQPGRKALGHIFKLMGGVMVYFAVKAGKEHRRAFFTMLRAAAMKGPWMVPKAVFLYTCFVMDHRRAMHDAAIARDQAAWEREHPEDLLPETDIIPLAGPVREQASEILSSLYQHVRPRTANRERLYQVAVESLIEFSDRFGNAMDSFGDAQRAELTLVCDRVVSALGASPEGDLPSDRPPAGFVREILDAADRRVRVGTG